MTSVRGPIRDWIERHAEGLGDDVLEVGSRQHVPGAWWVINRDLARGQWTGMGHRDDFSGQHDPDHALLREWIGADAEVYA